MYVVYACWCGSVTWQLATTGQFDIKSLIVGSYRMKYRLCFSDLETV